MFPSFPEFWSSFPSVLCCPDLFSSICLRFTIFLCPMVTPNRRPLGGASHVSPRWLPWSGAWRVPWRSSGRQWLGATSGPTWRRRSAHPGGGQGKCGLAFVGLTPQFAESLELLEVITWRFGEEMWMSPPVHSGKHILFYKWASGNRIWVWTCGIYPIKLPFERPSEMWKNGNICDQSEVLTG